MQIYRSPASILLRQAGDLIPLCACEGCYVCDGEISHPLHYGKMMHIPLWGRDKLHINIEEGCILYLLWVFKTKEQWENKKETSAEGI